MQTRVRAHKPQDLLLSPTDLALIPLKEHFVGTLNTNFSPDCPFKQLLLLDDQLIFDTKSLTKTNSFILDIGLP